MSKPIYLTQEHKNQYIEEFSKMLNASKMSGGEILFKKALPTVDEKTTLYFTPLAWDKMNALISQFNSEIGWHGLAKRGDDGDSYIIYDILVYPQTVTSATVTTDQSKYTKWLYSQNDEDFNAMRFHGHSHVRMGVTPSSTDIDHQTGILDQLEGDMFYIFMIYNKSMEYFIKIYDMKKNILFEKNDISIKLTGCDYDFDEFMKSSKSLVNQYTSAYNGGSTPNSGYSGSYNPGAKDKPVTKEEKKASEKPQFSGVKTSAESKEKKEQSKSGKEQKKKGTVVPVNSYYGSKRERYSYHDAEDYDICDYYD